jgi:hypothetical protein
MIIDMLLRRNLLSLDPSWPPVLHKFEKFENKVSFYSVYLGHHPKNQAK